MPRQEQEPTVKPGGFDGDGKVYEHPAFGHIAVSRVTGGGQTLFGSDFQHNSWVAVRIGTSSLNRSLARDWFFPERDFVEVYLSEAQWATFVSSFGQGSGVPCTITRRDGNMIPEIPFRDEKDEYGREMKTKIDITLVGLRQLVEDLEAGDKLPGVPKSKLAKLLKPLKDAIRELGSNLPFVAKSFDEHVEQRVEKAKAEIYGWMEQTVRRAGLEALTEREGAPLSLPAPKEEQSQ